MVLMREEDTCPEGTCWLKGSLKNASALKRDMGKLGHKQPHFTEAQEKKTPLYVWPKMPRAGEGGVSQTRQNENLPQTRELASATRSQGSGRHIFVDSGLCPCFWVLWSSSLVRQEWGSISLTVSYVASCQGWLRT